MSNPSAPIAPPASTGKSVENSIGKSAEKSTDAFSRWLQTFWAGILKNVKLVLGVAAAILGLTILSVLMSGQSQKREALAKDAWYLGQKNYLEENKSVSGPDGKKAEVDVNLSFSKTISAWSALIAEYPKTLAAYEARLALADLYADHGAYEKAADWFTEAADAAGNTRNRARAFLGLGFAREQMGQVTEAAAAYERAIQQGESVLHGELLLSLGRVYEKTDVEKARSTYERVRTDLAGTDEAKTAESALARLK